MSNKRDLDSPTSPDQKRSAAADFDVASRNSDVTSRNPVSRALGVYFHGTDTLTFLSEDKMPSQELQSKLSDLIDSPDDIRDYKTLTELLFFAVNIDGRRAILRADLLTDNLVPFSKDLSAVGILIPDDPRKAIGSVEGALILQNIVYAAYVVLLKKNLVNEWPAVQMREYIGCCTGSTEAAPFKLCRVVMYSSKFSHPSLDDYYRHDSAVPRPEAKDPSKERAVLLIYDCGTKSEPASYNGGGFRIIRETDVPCTCKSDFQWLCFYSMNCDKLNSALSKCVFFAGPHSWDSDEVLKYVDEKSALNESYRQQLIYPMRSALDQMWLLEQMRNKWDILQTFTTTPAFIANKGAIQDSKVVPQIVNVIYLQGNNGL